MVKIRRLSKVHARTWPHVRNHGKLDHIANGLLKNPQHDATAMAGANWEPVECCSKYILNLDKLTARMKYQSVHQATASQAVSSYSDAESFHSFLRRRSRILRLERGVLNNTLTFSRSLVFVCLQLQHAPSSVSDSLLCCHFLIVFCFFERKEILDGKSPIPSALKSTSFTLVTDFHPQHRY